MDPEKVRAVKMFPAPGDVRTIRSFVGLASYYRRFIKGFSNIAEPLTRLTKKDQEFIWGEEQVHAFETLKQKLTEEPLLAHFKPDAPTTLRTDASGFGIGAVLLQDQGAGLQPICYFSRLMNQHERNYPISEECLAIVFAVNKLKQYLMGIHFEIETDHCALCWIRAKSNLSGRLLRWSLNLMQYDYDVKYKSGKQHLDADCLSRSPVGGDSAPFDPEEQQYPMVGIVGNDSQSWIGDEQLKDTELAELIELITIGDKRVLEQFKLIDGALYKWKNIEDQERLFLCVPKALKGDILFAYHDDPVAGHLGRQRTLERIRSRFYWSGMTSEIIQYVSSCLDCQTRK